MMEPFVAVSDLPTLLPLKRDADHSLQSQLADNLRRLLLGGELPPGTRLPASRTFARQLGVSRNTVTAVFEQLAAEGYLQSRQGSGTRVAALPDHPPLAVPAVETPSKDVPGGGRGPRRSKKFSAPAFATGFPDVGAFPLGDWARVAGRVFRRAGPELLAYQGAAGQPDLRRELVDHLARTRGIRCGPEQVLITNGAQAGLDLVMRLMLPPGSHGLVEDPCWQGIRAAASLNGIRLTPVPVDDQGFDIGAAERLLPARMLFVTPSCQYPLGITMSLERRLALLDLARQRDCWILEDDYDSDLRYRGRPLAALQSLDATGRVIYTGTFSKAMFASLRIGYLVVPEKLVGRFTSALRITGQQPSPMLQLALAEFFREGYFGRHLRRMRKQYGKKQEALAGALQRHAGDLLEVEAGDAGMQLVAWLRRSVEAGRLRRMLSGDGFDIRLLSDLYDGVCPREGLFLGYAAMPLESIDGQCRALAASLRRAIEG